MTLRYSFLFITSSKYPISKYLPSIDKDWYDTVCDCIEYVKTSSVYSEQNQNVHSVGARLLYKIIKRHELGDGNKRTGVIVVFLFYLINDFVVTKSAALKQQAVRVAKTKGRNNEEMIRSRVAESLSKFVEGNTTKS